MPQSITPIISVTLKVTEQVIYKAQPITIYRKPFRITISMKPIYGLKWNGKLTV